MTWLAGLIAMTMIIALVLGRATRHHRPVRDTCPICRQADCTKEIL